jgi:hypothetical protein
MHRKTGVCIKCGSTKSVKYTIFGADACNRCALFSIGNNKRQTFELRKLGGLHEAKINRQNSSHA